MIGNLPAVRHRCHLSRNVARDPIGCANPYAFKSRCVNLDNAFILCLEFQKSDLPTLVRPHARVSMVSAIA